MASLPMPEPTPPIHDAVFERLKSDVLEALAQADAGELVSEEDAFAMFGIDQDNKNRVRLPLPEPTPIIRDAVFEQLKAELLEAMASADRGEGVTAEEMRRMFGLPARP